MLEVYSINTNVAANTYIPLNNVSYRKGNTAIPSGVSSIELNKCGVYMVSCDSSAGTSTTIQLYKNGVAQPQAQATGLNPNFLTLVSVDENNTCCPCTAPVTLQIMNTTETTFSDINVVVTKVK